MSSEEDSMEYATIESIHDGESLKRFKKERKVGEGGYAVVYEGKDLETGQRVAIKKIKMTTHGAGLDISAIREVRVLTELRHPNIVQLVDVFSYRSNLNLVLEFHDAHLEMVIRDRQIVLGPPDIKSWMLMLLRGLEYCHQRGILHRDIKPNNLLIGCGGEIKIADFGLARCWSPPLEPMTSQVATRWYRAPELLFGARYYTGAVDVWSAGCIFAELMLRTPFMVGETDMGQIKEMTKALGTPTERDWPGLKSLPDYVEFPPLAKPPLASIFRAASADALDLLDRMLTYDPLKRITAREALGHSYFANLPRPTDPANLPLADAIAFSKQLEAQKQTMYQARVSEVKPRKLFQ